MLVADVPATGLLAADVLAAGVFLFNTSAAVFAFLIAIIAIWRQ